MTASFSKFRGHLLAIITMLAIISCQKQIDNTGNNTYNPPTPPDLSSKVFSSVSGFVTDENDGALSGASVSFGNATTVTDKYGYFKFVDISVVKEAAVVTVNKLSYFPGIKTFRAETDKSAFFRIKLIPKTNAGNINATSGGTTTLNNGLSVSLPASGVVVASNNSPYTGTVNVAATWINPTAKDLDLIMPGDLRGINTNGIMNGLTTFGMCAVELTVSGGEKLQIAAGKKATLSFPIPSSMNSVAPASIPLWYFDEDKGLWVEEGIATKTGNSYVGTVSHFSFWNCDVPDEYVNFSCTLLNSDGNTIPYAYIKMTEVGNPNNTRGGFTNDSGYVSGIIPANTALQVQIFTNYYQGCNLPFYSQSITTANTDIHLTLNVPSAVVLQADVTGSATDCNGAPLSNGYIMMFDGHYNYRYALDSAGHYSFSKILCDNSLNVNFIAEDPNSLQQSTPLPYILSDGSHAIPAIQACGTSISEFINYTINGNAYTMAAPADSFIMFLNPQTNPPRIEIHGSSNVPTVPPSNYNISLGFSEAGIMAGSAQSLALFYTTQISEWPSIATPINVNITEYGALGEFIAGNFSGTLVGAAPNFTQYNVTCSFRKRRTQ